jgi:hypothetical protein
MFDGRSGVRINENSIDCRTRRQLHPDQRVLADDPIATGAIARTVSGGIQTFVRSAAIELPLRLADQYRHDYGFHRGVGGLTLLFLSSMFATMLTRVASARNERRLGTLGAFFHLLGETRVHVHVILAVGAALGAYFSGGILRVVLIVVAVLLGALVTWDVLVAAYGTILVWGVKRWRDQRRAREAHPPDVT